MPCLKPRTKPVVFARVAKGCYSALRKARCAPEFAVRFQQYLTAPQRDMETRRARWAAVAAMCAVTAAVPRTPRARVARPTPLAARSLHIEGGAREADRDAVETENRERLSVGGVQNASSPLTRPGRRARARRCRRAP